MVELPEILVGLFGFLDFLDDLFRGFFFFLVRGYFGDDLLDVLDDFVDLDFLDVLGVPLLFDQIG